MPLETVRQILDYARKLHGHLADLYEVTAREVRGSKVKLLLDYLARRERELAEGLKQFEDQAGAATMNTWFQEVPEDQFQDTLAGLSIRPDMELSGVVEMALRLDDCILDMYRKLAENAPPGETRELFQNLLAQEEHEEIRIAQIAQDIERLL